MREFSKLECLARGQHMLAIERQSGQWFWVCSNGKDAMIKGEAAGAVFSFDTHLVVRLKPAFACDDLNFAPFQQLSDAARQALNDTILPGAQFAEVNLHLAEANPHGCQCWILPGTVGSSKQGFGWNTTQIQAGASWGTRIDDSYLLPQLCSPDCCNVPAWTCTENDNIDCGCDITNNHLFHLQR